MIQNVVELVYDILVSADVLPDMPVARGRNVDHVSRADNGNGLDHETVVWVTTTAVGAAMGKEDCRKKSVCNLGAMGRMIPSQYIGIVFS